MEVGETLRRIFRRESADREEVIMERVVDILSRQDPVLVHATDIAKANTKLREGLISSELAVRIESKDFEHRRSRPDPYVWLTVGPFRVGGALKHSLGIIAKPTGPLFWNTPELTPVEKLEIGREVVALNRVAPREFTGLVLPDNQLIWEKSLRKVLSSMRKSGLSLPVYTRNGDLIWPKQMSHEEIVQLLKERNDTT